MAARADTFYGGQGYGTDAAPDRYLLWGSGSPQGTVTGGLGSIYVDLDTGTVYRKTAGSGNTGWSAGLNALSTSDGSLQIGDPTSTVNNLEPTPAVVRYALRLAAPALQGGDNEATAVYARISPSSAQKYALYAELQNQPDTYGGIAKVIHYGRGDAVYIALRGSGAIAAEAASYAWDTRGFISTLQRNQSGSGGGTADFTYATLFNGVWGDDGTGGSQVPPAYGMYYADRSLGNSFRTRKQDPLATGAADGRVEWSISEFNLLRDRVRVYNNGQIDISSPLAPGGAPTFEPVYKIVVQHTGNDRSAYIKNHATTSTANQVEVWVGADGAETKQLTVDSTGKVTLKNGAQMLDGSADPTAGAGVPANLGSLYLRTNGSMYLKTGAGDTAWTLK